MELAYLLEPAFQYMNRDGRPLTGGFLKVFRHGTTVPYITRKNFDGDMNPAEIPLDALGMAVVLAEPGFSYDVFLFDVNRVEQWSRVNVSPGEGTGNTAWHGAHRLLRYYTDSEQADEGHPAGDWLHDLEVDDPGDPSGHPMVTAEQLFGWMDEGQTFELYEVSRTGGYREWHSVYQQTRWDDQTDWWERYSHREGKCCRIEFWRGGFSSTVNRVGLIAYTRHIDEDYMRILEIQQGQPVWEMKLAPVQPE